MPREVVPIETRPGRPSDIFSISRCMGNSTWARLLMNRFPFTGTPAASSVSISFSRAAGSITSPLPITACFPGRSMPLGISFRTILPVADKDGVPGVVPALIPGDDVEALREEIDNFPFALIAPLRAQYYDIPHLNQTLYSTVSGLVRLAATGAV